MNDLKQMLEERARRGDATGSDQLRQRVALTLAAGKSTGPAHEPGHRLSGPLVALAAAVVALVAIGSVALIFRTTGSPVAEQPPPISTSAVEGPVILSGVFGLESIGGSTWAWTGEEIWRYSEGDWSLYSAAPPPPSQWPSDLAYDGDTLWVLVDTGADDPPDGYTGVYFLDGNDWRLLEGNDWHRPTEGLGRVAADPDTGVLWLSSGKDLFRWDGAEMTNVGLPPEWEGSAIWVMDIGVTADGAVEVLGLNVYNPLGIGDPSGGGGLARYDDETGTWEIVAPPSGDSPIPLGGMPLGGMPVLTADGDLWGALPDLTEGWMPGDPLSGARLARYMSTTGEWTVYDAWLPDFDFAVIAAGDDSLWIAQGHGGKEATGEMVGIVGFDGETWTTYLEGTPATDPVDNITVASDGTIWYVRSDQLHQLERGTP